MASQRFAFPVPERALPRIRVTPEQHEELRAFAVRAAQDILREGPTWGRSNVQAARERGWKVSQKSPDICFMMKTTATSKPTKATRTRPASTGGMHTVPSAHSISSDESPWEHGTPHQLRQGGGRNGGRAFMGAVRLAGYNLDDVISAIHCETTSVQRDQLSTSYGAAYLDCAILQTLEGAKPFDPFWYLGLKWTALRSPVEKLVNHREFVYLEHSGTHVNAQGQRMLYRIIQSLTLEEFGGESAYFGLTRAHLEAAYVYWMDTPLHHLPGMAHSDDTGVLTVCTKGLAHPKGKVPLWLVERYVKKFWKAGWSLRGSEGAAVSTHDDSRQITLDLATEWVADADRKACALCQKKFRFGRRMRHHCRACGEVICRNCTQYFLLTYPTSTTSSTPFNPADSFRKSQRKGKRAVHDDDEMPATLGEELNSKRGRLRVASDNDAVMVGKVCRRCVEMKKVAIRRNTSRTSSTKKNRSSHRTRTLSWENNPTGLNHKPMPIHETDERDEHEFPIMGHDEESDAEYFVPETPGPNMNNRYYHNQPQHDDHDDTASEFSIGDFEASQAFKPYSTLDFKAFGEQKAIHEDTTGTSFTSKFSQSGFSVGIGVHDVDSDDDDGIVDYHSDPEPDARLHHPQLGHLSSQTVEEEQFTSSQKQRAPPPVAQNFVLTAAALNTRPKQDARLRLEDLLADTDDEDEQDYSTSPPLRPSALEIKEMRPQPHLIRTTSAPPLSTQRTAPPPVPVRRAESAEVEDSIAALHVGKYHIQPNRDQNRESNLSTLSFSSFDADMLIDATAFDHDDPRMSAMMGVDEEDEDTLYARIQNIQDEVLRRQLLAESTASSAASSLSPSFGNGMRLNRQPSVPFNGINGTTLSEGSTISSTESFGSVPKDAVHREPTQQHAAKKAHNAMQTQVANAIADQAQLLYRIQMERDRGTSDQRAGIKLY